MAVVKRLAPAGVPLEQLPPLDIVTVSHNHYDHLDAPTITRLGPGPLYLTPVGNGRWLHKAGATNVVELHW